MPPTPLLSAIASRDLARLKTMLAKLRDPIPARAIGAAAGNGWKDGVVALADAGGDLNALHRNYRPLHALIQEKPHVGGSSTAERLACLEWMLAHGADPEQLGAWPLARALVIAAFVGEPAYVRALVDAGASRDIFTAAALGDVAVVKALLKKDRALAATRDQGLLTTLQCCGGSRMGASDKTIAAALVEIARALADAGADPNAQTKSWAHHVAVSYFVIRSGQIETLKLLLGRGMDATAAVGTAAWENREDVLDVLLAHGAELNRAKDNARPVLNELVRWGQFANARLLLRKGADPNIADDKGWTALHQAASRGNVQMIKDLIAAGADPTRRGKDGDTPGDVALIKNKPAVVSLFGVDATPSTRRR